MLTYDKAFWESVRTEEKYCAMRETLAELYDTYHEPIKILPYSEFKLFYETGDRSVYGATYFMKRKQLSVAAMMYLIYGEEKYRYRLEDVIWAICDEYTWSLPAHIKTDKLEEQTTFIDLFSSETAYSLAEIHALVGDKLAKIVCDRVKYEIDRRIIQPFLHTRCYWWEDARNNWAAVCGCQVAGTFMYMAPELFPVIKARIDAAMRCFLSGFGNDGACLEGVSYWIYGFGFFVQYQELQSTFDPDKLKIFQDQKIKNIAMFFQKVCLKDGIAVTFADSQPQALYSAPLMHYLKRIYGSMVKMPPAELALPLARTTKFSSLVRSFLYYNPEDNEKEQLACNCYFTDAQWFIRENAWYSFAAKGGCNAEPHNHNDVGSFLACRYGRQVLCDIGVGVYTKDYFSDKRYTLLGNASRGHSVPIINGKEQRCGDEYKARSVLQNGDTFRLDILGAYDEQGSLIRTFTTLDKSVCITDSYQLEYQPTEVIERFVSFEKPQVEKGCIMWKGLCLKFDSEQLALTVSEEPYENNFIGKVTVYLLDLKVIKPFRKMKVIIKLIANEG